VQIDVAHAGVLLFDDLVDVAGAARCVKLKLDVRKSLLKTGLEFLAQLRAAGNGDHHSAFLFRRFYGSFPFRTFALSRLGHGDGRRQQRQYQQPEK